jgi:hypothetical protein
MELAPPGNHPRGSHDKQSTKFTKSFTSDYPWLFLQNYRHFLCSSLAKDLGAFLLCLVVLKCGSAILFYILVHSKGMKL